ncbi:hypothetical protein [Laspinema olomoucense]|uniref:hypothetical protein n=1 Tax=Laspinema olomoucense TaxID=3231600 RepID=UPI0021BB7A83|nr:hypothetical protein [Laspinema sp. D3d]MCT7971145.1 hypothetical protein [Laspinema sp. D3d]
MNKFGLTLLMILSAILIQNKVSANTIVELNGRAYVNRNGIVNQVSQGQRLQFGDILRTQRGTSLKILCSTGQLWNVPEDVFSGVAGGCRSRLSRFRSGDRISISPLTRIQPNQPFNIAWSSNLESAEATVTISSDLGQIWSGTGIGSVSIPRFDPGFYKVTVTIGEAARETAQFEVVKLDELNLIQNQIQEIIALNLSEEQHQLAIANIYISAGLHYDALFVLTQLNTAESFLLAGDLFKQLGLTEKAATQYSQALLIALENRQSDLISLILFTLLN